MLRQSKRFLDTAKTIGKNLLNTMNNQKIALVTGGNRGIGYAIAIGLVAKGYQVIITARSLEKAQQAAEKLQGNVNTSIGYSEETSPSLSVIPVELDISSDRSVEAAVTTIKQKSDRLDVLINNAGIYPDEGVNILTIERELLDLTFNTNTFGAIRMVQTLLPLLEKSEDVRVII
jgi:NAD(P)-dependent dehydrogenase (short-subunit alcohol dehydrogenase family)